MVIFRPLRFYWKKAVSRLAPFDFEQEPTRGSGLFLRQLKNSTGFAADVTPLSLFENSFANPVFSDQ
jgi:hypothetical protein